MQLCTRQIVTRIRNYDRITEKYKNKATCVICGENAYLNDIHILCRNHEMIPRKCGQQLNYRFPVKTNLSYYLCHFWKGLNSSFCQYWQQNNFMNKYSMNECNSFKMYFQGAITQKKRKMSNYKIIHLIKKIHRTFSFRAPLSSLNF